MTEPSLERRFTDVNKTLDALHNYNNEIKKILLTNKFRLVDNFSQINRIKLTKSPNRLSTTIKPLVTVHNFDKKIFYSFIVATIIIRFNPSFAFVLVMIFLFFTITGQIDKWIDSSMELKINIENSILEIERKIFE
ncbi:hypothetical protein [Synechocystis sp. PCC 7509]|uniref:hypothetical protein n=1 Tax=Synechocystis sp. PCC 7509 TaxID=927677 RepID=UPI0002ABCF9C|nr:hypothetical protein [Synechocystis sp. PCC 7509]